MKTLVIYFSQTGKTKEAAERIAQLSGADLVEAYVQFATFPLVINAYNIT